MKDQETIYPLQALAAQCSTQEKADKVVQIFKDNGFIWRHGPTPQEANYWPKFKERTCYQVERGFLVVSSSSFVSGKMIFSDNVFLKQHQKDNG